MSSGKIINFDCSTSPVSYCTGMCMHDSSTVKEYHSTLFPDGIVLLCDYQVSYAAACGWYVGGATLTLVEDDLAVIVNPNIKAEAPCKNCQQMNDKGIAICWWCEVENPC